MSRHRKPKRNARRQARSVKRDFSARTVREFPPIRVTPEGREFMRRSAQEGQPHE
ncbi:MAG: hypothetical protein MEQ07_09245 [Aquimonas sp.]|nr:hypothetical protein [Aquimonas sp.]